MLLLSPEEPKLTAGLSRSQLRKRGGWLHLGNFLNYDSFPLYLSFTSSNRGCKMNRGTKFCKIYIF